MVRHAPTLILIPFPLASILILIPISPPMRRLRRMRELAPAMSRRPVSLPQMPQAMHAAMAWPSVQHNFREVQYAMQPMLWSSLGLGSALEDCYLKMLVQEQVVAQVRRSQMWKDRHFQMLYDKDNGPEGAASKQDAQDAAGDQS